MIILPPSLFGAVHGQLVPKGPMSIEGSGGERFVQSYMDNDATKATRLLWVLMFERFKSLKDSKEPMRPEEGEEEDLIAVLMISTQSLELLRMTLLPPDLSKTTYC